MDISNKDMRAIEEARCALSQALSSVKALALSDNPLLCEIAIDMVNPLDLAEQKLSRLATLLGKNH